MYLHVVRIYLIEVRIAMCNSVFLSIQVEWMESTCRHISGVALTTCRVDGLAGLWTDKTFY